MHPNGNETVFVLLKPFAGSIWLEYQLQQEGFYGAGNHETIY